MPQRNRRPYDGPKRGIDVITAAIGLIVTAPLQLAIAAAVLITQGRPVLFRQLRPGRDGVLFELVKFRSMRQHDATRTTDAERLTGTGKFLRATSLDELPTLWNVLVGDMSIVGPRPLLEEYLERYSPEEARRHEVRPGITGLAQVNGRNGIGWEDRFAFDVKYVDKMSLRLDVHIIRATIRTVSAREGISAPGQATMRKFGTIDD